MNITDLLNLSNHVLRTTYINCIIDQSILIRSPRVKPLTCLTTSFMILSSREKERETANIKKSEIYQFTNFKLLYNSLMLISRLFRVTVKDALLRLTLCT